MILVHKTQQPQGLVHASHLPKKFLGPCSVMAEAQGWLASMKEAEDAGRLRRDFVLTFVHLPRQKKRGNHVQNTWIITMS